MPGDQIALTTEFCNGPIAFEDQKPDAFAAILRRQNVAGCLQLLVRPQRSQLQQLRGRRGGGRGPLANWILTVRLAAGQRVLVPQAFLTKLLI